MARTRASLVVVALLASAGCAAIQGIEKFNAITMERKLAAAGFQMKFATTPAQIAKTESLPQYQLTACVGPDGKTRFVWADATDCKCIYVGTEAAYDRYRALEIEQQIAESEEAASMNWEEWGAWGPWY